MAFDNFASPTLPMPPKEYSFEYFNQLVRSLGTYFRVLDSRTPMNTSVLTSDMFRVPTFDLVLSGSIENNLSAPLSSFIRIAVSPSSAFTLTGLGNGSDGRSLTLFNSTTASMTITNEDSRSSPENRIITCTGSSIVLSGQAVVNLIYSIKDSRWIVTSTQG